MPEQSPQGYPMPGWNGLMCAFCSWAILSPDTAEGLVELMWLHMAQNHPGTPWTDTQGRKHRNAQ
jgi:hypothetical protein